MIRYARRALSFVRTALLEPEVQLALAGIALDFGVKTIVNITTKLVDEVREATAQLDVLRSQTQLAGGGQYPRPVDLDPLGHGERAAVEDLLPPVVD